MACETCDHTMQRVNEGINPKVFWCPRCGTIKSKCEIIAPANADAQWSKPELVDRALALCGVALDVISRPDIHAEAMKEPERAVRECCLS